MCAVPHLPKLPTLDGLDVNGKRVLLRADHNIPARADGKLADDWRLIASLPTLKRLLKSGARVGILTHRGRPGGRVVPNLSTKPLAEALTALLGQNVEFVEDCVGRVAEQAMAKLAPGQVAMFENTRFHLGEQMNQLPFVEQLARLGEIFVNDAFATAHRAHASTSGLAAHMKPSVVGELVMQELAWLRRVADNPPGPVVLVIGGTNVAPKLDLLRYMMTRVDTLMIGGAVAQTFLAARDLGVGQSLMDPTWVETARDLLTEAGVVGCRLHLPQDVVVHDTLDPARPTKTKAAHVIAAQESVVDIGPNTLATWQRLLKEAGTTIWLGCVGMVEIEAGRAGTMGLATVLSTSKGFSLVGGNGLLPALQVAGLRDRLPAVSTGGAALQAGLLGQPLPCLNLLQGHGPEWKGLERRKTLR